MFEPEQHAAQRFASLLGMRDDLFALPQRRPPGGKDGRIDSIGAEGQSTSE